MNTSKTKDKYRIAVVPGDGIGKEVMEATILVLDALDIDFDYVYGEAGDECGKKNGTPLPGETLDIIRSCDACLFGAAGESAADVIVKIRQEMKTMATQNYAGVFSTKVDERFSRESQAAMALNNDYKFTGVKTVNLYTVPTVALQDYNRTGERRYGTPEDLGTEVQTLTIGKDRSWTFIIDRGDKLQSQMASDAGKSIQRQLREVWIPRRIWELAQ